MTPYKEIIVIHFVTYLPEDLKRIETETDLLPLNKCLAVHMFLMKGSQLDNLPKYFPLNIERLKRIFIVYRFNA